MTIDILSVIGGTASTSSLIPARDPNSITGSTFIQNNMNIKGSQRESNILNEFLQGNIPNFLRNFVQVTVSSTANSITYLAMPDVLCIGSDDDFCRMPMDPHTAQAIADRYDCTLPTVKMVDCIWQGATNKLEPKPWGPPYDDSMSDTYRYGVHNQTVQTQMTSLGLSWQNLTSGHKKDVVITNHLAPNNPNKRVAIYGWIQTNGQAIQPLNPTSHADVYEDYSHGIRMITNDCLVNGNPMRMKDVFVHPVYSALVSYEGPVTFQRY